MRSPVPIMLFFCFLPFLLNAAAEGAELKCTFVRCSLSSPCKVGTCNNGFCCESQRSHHRSPQHILPKSDWSRLGEKENQFCVGGFSSAIKCGFYGSCPPGLICEYKNRLCCPLLIDQKPRTFSSLRRHFHQHPASRWGFSAFSPPTSFYGRSNNYGFRRPMSAYPCVTPNCDDPSSFYTNSVLNGWSSPSDSECPEGTGSCVDGRCGNGYSCDRNHVCCERSLPATVCPDGTQAAGGCVNGQCGMGFMCNQGLCCTNSSQTPRCLDGSQAIGACIGGKCGEGFSCTTGNICCPSTLSMCPAGTTAIGPCVNGVCPVGYSCVNNQCCGPPAIASSTAMLASCAQIDSNGQCQSDNTCPDPGYSCDVTNLWCCPNITGDAVGPCIRGEGGTRLCPDGYACSGPDGGQCYRLETGTCAPQDQFGPCNFTEPKCPPGYSCIGGFCCSDNSPVYRRRRRSALLL